MTSRCSTRRRCSATDGETYVSDPTRGRHSPTRPAPPASVPFFTDIITRPLSSSQVDAAEATYRKLNNAVKNDVVGNARKMALTHWETQQIAKLTAMLSLRTKELRRGDDLGIGEDACKDLREYFDHFLLDPKAEFPFDVAPEAVGERPVELQMEELDIASSSAAIKDRASPESSSQGAQGFIEVHPRRRDWWG